MSPPFASQTSLNFVRCPHPSLNIWSDVPNWNVRCPTPTNSQPQLVFSAKLVMTEDLGGLSWPFMGLQWYYHSPLVWNSNRGTEEKFTVEYLFNSWFVLWADNSCNMWFIWEWLSARPDRGLLGTFYDLWSISEKTCDLSLEFGGQCVPSWGSLPCLWKWPICVYIWLNVFSTS